MTVEVNFKDGCFERFTKIEKIETYRDHIFMYHERHGLNYKTTTIFFKEIKDYKVSDF